MEEIAMYIERVRCGIPDCDWGVPVKAGSLELGPMSLDLMYERFWNHCVALHGLNPDTRELPGMEEASFMVDLTGGGMMTVRMRAEE